VNAKKQILFSILTAYSFWAIQTFATGEITSIKPEEHRVKLAIKTDPNDTYQIQCTTNLVSGTWEDVGFKVIGNASASTNTVRIAADSCMYRVVKVGQYTGSTPTPPTSAPPRFSPPPPPPPSSI